MYRFRTRKFIFRKTVVRTGIKSIRLTFRKEGGGGREEEEEEEEEEKKAKEKLLLPLYISFFSSFLWIFCKHTVPYLHVQPSS